MDQDTKSISQWNNKHVTFQWSLQSNWYCYWFWKIVILGYIYFSKRLSWFCWFSQNFLCFRKWLPQSVIKFPSLSNNIKLLFFLKMIPPLYYLANLITKWEATARWNKALLQSVVSIIKYVNLYYRVGQICISTFEDKCYWKLRLLWEK